MVALIRESTLQLLKYSLGIICKSIYISMDFQISEGLSRGPEFSHNYTIDYLIDYIITT